MLIFYRFQDITIYWLKISVFYAAFTHTSHVKLSHEGGFPSDLGYESWYQKPRLSGLHGGENCVIVSSLMLCQQQRVTDRQTDRQTWTVLSTRLIVTPICGSVEFGSNTLCQTSTNAEKFCHSNKFDLI